MLGMTLEMLTFDTRSVAELVFSSIEYKLFHDSQSFTKSMIS